MTHKKCNVLIYLILIMLFSVDLRSQADCVLGVGITEDETLITIFQMNEMQQENLVNFGAELKYRNEILNNQLANIMQRHPQSTPTELGQLADKYKAVMDSMQMIQAFIDKKVLWLFNEKQYELYLELCKEASRSPFIVVPTVYNDSITRKD
ncbi:hypothetical protein BFP77_10675 [Maribacter sp. 4U21]|uniref:hypothetical protein n=1 Tax=Maribacter sp. 4U21 TaxID=1889779 RepID=UPI000C14CCC9|nr:hypothetical protein [Maribacter sp. 4U21]PIB28106.1 hypothetical protein BFP77_10675 [Maribacter sp. 4U21]